MKNTDINSGVVNPLENTQKAQAELDTVEVNGDKLYILPSGLEFSIKDDRVKKELMDELGIYKQKNESLNRTLLKKLDEIEMYHKKTFKKEITSLIKFPEGYKDKIYYKNSDDYTYSLENFIEDLRILLQFYQKGPDKIVKSLEIFEGGDIKVRYQDVKTKF